MKFFSKLSLVFIAAMSAPSAFAKQDGCAAIAAVYNSQPNVYKCVVEQWELIGGQYVPKLYFCYEKATYNSWNLNVTAGGGCTATTPGA